MKTQFSNATCLALLCAYIAGCDGPSAPPASHSKSNSSGGAAGAPAPSAAPTKDAAKQVAAAPKESTPVARPWKPIAQGKEFGFAGVTAQVPATWNIVPQGNATLAMPAGANQTAIEEIYGFVGEPTLKSIDGTELEAYLDSAVMQLLQVPAQRSGPGVSTKVGALDGKKWMWRARLMDGRDVEVSAWGFVGSYAGSFVAIATSDVMRRRMSEIEAILASVHRPEVVAIEAARICRTWVRAFGSGSALIGDSNEQRFTFDSSGRFHYHSEGTSHGVFHLGSTQTDVSGTWKLTGDQLTGVADTGESKTVTVEARTEPGTGVAVIALDGTEFRDAAGRPW